MKYYLTTPIYYVNDSPHIGHAYTTLACDVIARFMRLAGKEVKFTTGTDEHGQKVAKAAAKAGIEPRKFVDQVSERFRDLCQVMNFSNDDFIRTTEERHKKAAQELWRRIDVAGYIYKSKYSGWYSVRDEAYYAESELVDGKAPTGAEVEWVEEESYFFKLSAFQEKLLKLYENNPEFIAPKSRRNEVISFVKSGLQDLSISRTRFDWGVPVPNDSDHVMYVWIDALTNYLSTCGFPDEQYKTWWPADLHMVGKDILRFHAVYWPAFLMAAEIELPKRVFAHGWWKNEGEKMSKSIGNIIDPYKLVEEFGLDQTRYFLLREFTFGEDGNFSHERMTSVINSELSNNIGNLVQRTLSIIHKNCDGKIPEVKLCDAGNGFLAEVKEILKIGEIGEQYIIDAIYRQDFQIVYQCILDTANRANEFIDTQAPWKLKKENPKRMKGVLYVLAEAIRQIAIILQPFIPASAEKILTQIGYDTVQAKAGVKFSELDSPLKPGTELGKLEPVFPRL